MLGAAEPGRAWHRPPGSRHHFQISPGVPRRKQQGLAWPSLQLVRDCFQRCGLSGEQETALGIQEGYRDCAVIFYRAEAVAGSGQAQGVRDSVCVGSSVSHRSLRLRDSCGRPRDPFGLYGQHAPGPVCAKPSVQTPPVQTVQTQRDRANAAPAPSGSVSCLGLA